MSNACGVAFWLGWQDSNLRMPESKSGALPLGDIPLSGKDRRVLRRALRAAAGGAVAHTVRRYRGRQVKNLSIFELRLPRSVAPGKAAFVWGE